MAEFRTQHPGLYCTRLESDGTLHDNLDGKRTREGIRALPLPTKLFLGRANVAVWSHSGKEVVQHPDTTVANQRMDVPPTSLGLLEIATEDGRSAPAKSSTQRLDASCAELRP